MKLTFRTKPMSQQKEALRRMEDRKGMDRYYYGLFMEQGTGKTWVAIQRAARLFASTPREIDAVIIVAPSGVHEQWVDEQLPEHWPKGAEYNAFSYSAGMGVRRKKEWAQFLVDTAMDRKRLHILAVNQETFVHKAHLREAIDKFIACAGKIMIIVDESDGFKNSKAGRTKNLYHRRRKFLHRYILTGTPDPQGPFDLYAQFDFLNPKILGNSEVAFKSRYAEMLGATDELMYAIRAKTGAKFLPAIVAKDEDGRPKYRNLDELQKIVAAHSYRVLKRDCMDLPDKVYIRRYCEMTPRQRRIYDNALGTLRIEWDTAAGDPRTVIATRLTLLGRLHQIAGGFTPDQQSIFADGKEDNPKLAALLATVCKQPNAIIWARHTPEVEMIVEALEEHGEVAAYYGAVSKGKRKKAKQQFVAREARFFVGNMQAGGVGLNLAVSSFMHYYSNAFPLRLRLQSEDRAHRRGMPNEKLTIYDYEAKGTVDRKIIRTLRANREIAATVLGDIGLGEWLND